MNLASFPLHFLAFLHILLVVRNISKIFQLVLKTQIHHQVPEHLHITTAAA
jgi:hypothetical protein